MNKKLILICICALALTCAGLQALAQDKPGDQPAPQTAPGAQTNPQPSTDASQANVSDPEAAAAVDARLQQLTTELGLSDDQKTQIKPILLDAAKRLQAVKNDSTRTIEAKKSKMDEVHDSARGQIRQFLTPEQSKKLDAMKAGDII
jgi:Spy/CpxP family protein refolding chaperone